MTDRRLLSLASRASRCTRTNRARIRPATPSPGVGSAGSVPCPPVAGVSRRIARCFALVGVISFLSGSIVSAAGEDASHRISRARFSSEGYWFVVRIDSSAPWAHWTLANPPRIIVDLGEAVTEMPNAPRLYEMTMPEGPIKRLRTSQFMNTSLDRRVRFTFEMDEIAVYEARRVGESIEIRIACAKPGASRTWELTAAGFHETTAPWSATSAAPETGLLPRMSPVAVEESDPGMGTPKAMEPAHGAPSQETGLKSGAEANSADSEAGFPESHTESDEAPDNVGAGFDKSPREVSDDLDTWTGGADPGEEPVDGDVSHDEGEYGEMSASDAADDPAYSGTAPSRNRPPSRLLDALAAVFDTSRSGSVEPESASNRTASGLDQSTQNENEGGSGDGLDEARISLEQLLGAANVDHVREVHGKMIDDDVQSPRLDADVIPDSLGSVVEDDYPLDEPAESSDVVRERAARRLLNEAVQEWTDGNVSRAKSLCDRVRRHYPLYPSAQQSLVLEREIHLAAGNAALAATLPAYPVLPDSGVISEEGFLRFLDEHWKLDQVDQVERLIETWGPLYPDGSWKGATRFALGEHYYRERDLLRAERYLVSIAPDDSLGARALAMRARLRDEAGDKASALALYGELARLEPGPYQLRGLARTADLQFQSGNVDSALVAYREIEAEADDAESPWAIYQIGNCHTLLGDVRAAAEAYERVISAYPGSYWAESARSQLQSLDWQKDLVRQVEGMQGR